MSPYDYVTYSLQLLLVFSKPAQFIMSDSVKVYTINGAASGSATSLPDWLIRKRAAKKGGKKSVTREHVQGTIDLIQHFEFPEASNRIRTTRDGHHAVATGVYKPQMRVWDLDQLTLKFERHSDAENVDFLVSLYSQSPPFPQKAPYHSSLFSFFLSIY